MSEFLTINSGVGDGVDAELEIKRSRFLTRLCRVISEGTVCVVIKERRSRFLDTCRHCSVFVLGPEAHIAYSSDDGESAGAVGASMLNAPTSNHLTDVMAVVTRYLGDIKLSAGGLVWVYSEVVIQAVTVVGTEWVELCSLLGINVGFVSIGAVEDLPYGLVLPSGTAVAVVGVDWGDRARITVAAPVTVIGGFDALLAASSAGALTAVLAGQRWVDRPDGQPFLGSMCFTTAGCPSTSISTDPPSVIHANGAQRVTGNGMPVTTTMAGKPV